MIIWLTGQPGDGKTTIARWLVGRIERSIHVDGSELSRIFGEGAESFDSRYRSMRRAQDIAQFLWAKGFTPVVSMVSPYRDARDEYKSKLPVAEIYVKAEETRERANTRWADYLPPLDNALVVDTTGQAIEVCGEAVLKYLEQKHAEFSEHPVWGKKT